MIFYSWMSDESAGDGSETDSAPSRRRFTTKYNRQSNVQKKKKCSLSSDGDSGEENKRYKYFLIF